MTTGRSGKEKTMVMLGCLHANKLGSDISTTVFAPTSQSEQVRQWAWNCPTLLLKFQKLLLRDPPATSQLSALSPDLSRPSSVLEFADLLVRKLQLDLKILLFLRNKEAGHGVVHG